MIRSEDDAKLKESEYLRSLTHIMLDMYDCKNLEALSDVKIVEQILVTAAKAARMTIVGKSFHKFGGEHRNGLTGVVLLAKSHISIHTYPLHNFVAADIFTCDRENIMLACDVLKELLESANVEIKTRKRGEEFYNPEKRRQ